MKSKIFKMFLCGTLAISMLVGCGNYGGTPTTTQTSVTSETDQTTEVKVQIADDAKVMKLASSVAETHPTNIAFTEVFKPMVEGKSKGTIAVELYNSGALGGEKELYDSVRNGNIEAVIVGTVMWDEFPKMAIPDWPFLFRDLAHAETFYSSDITRKIADEVEAGGKVQFLSWHPNGARQFSCSKPLEKIENFQGLRLRMPNNPIHIKLGELLGANVTPMPMGEVFAALEQGVVDGQDNPIATLRSQGWYEVQDYVYESNHMISSLELLVGNEFWASLTPKEQEILEEAALAASSESWKLYEQSLVDDKKFLEESGIKFTIPTEEEKAKLIEIVQLIYDGFYEEYDWAKELVKEIRAIQ